MSRRVASNAVWNVAGTLVTLLVGLAALPVLLHTLGPARLGIFTLALGLIGFAGLLDLGLGRALTQGVASALGVGRSCKAVAALIWRVLRFLAVFGVLWLLVLWWLAPVLVHHLFGLQGDLAAEAIFGLRAVALSLPFALVATGAMGSLEGMQHFRRVSTQRAALSTVQFGLPALVSLLYTDVGWVIAALAASRVLSVAVWLYSLRRVLPRLHGQQHHRGDLNHLLRFGGWLSVSNMIGPLMVYADRFYLASLFPPAAVAVYTVPYDALYRLTSLPVMGIAAVFPALAKEKSKPESSAPMVRAAAEVVVALMLPPLLVLTIFAKPLLTLWLGQSFALPVVPVFQLLVLGIFANSAAHVPYAILQAYGRSDLTAKLHLLELPVFIGLLVWAVSVWGVYGAALAWTLRVVLDTGMLYGLAMLLQPSQRSVLGQGLAMAVLATIALLLPLLTSNHLLLASITVLTLITSTAMLLRLNRQWRRTMPA